MLNFYALRREYKTCMFNKFVPMKEGIENLDKRQYDVKQLDIINL